MHARSVGPISRPIQRGRVEGSRLHVVALPRADATRPSRCLRSLAVVRASATASRARRRTPGREFRQGERMSGGSLHGGSHFQFEAAALAAARTDRGSKGSRNEGSVHSESGRSLLTAALISSGSMDLGASPRVLSPNMSNSGTPTASQPAPVAEAQSSGEMGRVAPPPARPGWVRDVPAEDQARCCHSAPGIRHRPLLARPAHETPPALLLAACRSHGRCHAWEPTAHRAHRIDRRFAPSDLLRPIERRGGRRGSPGLCRRASQLGAAVKFGPCEQRCLS